MEPNRLVARRDELETIERFCAGASTGEGATALAISGPAGIGKTTVWRAGVERARSQGWRVLVAEAANREAALSFAGLADLLATVDDALLESPPPPQRRALAAALLRADDAGSSDFRALAAATTTVLGELAASQPTLSGSTRPRQMRFGSRCGASAEPPSPRSSRCGSAAAAPRRSRRRSRANGAASSSSRRSPSPPCTR